MSVPEEDKSNNKKNPAPSSSREATTHQHKAKQVSITNKQKNQILFATNFFYQNVITTIINSIRH
jgi:hypothetical protein